MIFVHMRDTEDGDSLTISAAHVTKGSTFMICNHAWVAESCTQTMHSLKHSRHRFVKVWTYDACLCT